MGLAVLVMAEAPPAPGSSALEPLLGAEGCARLESLLLRRAARWAVESAPGAAFVAVHPGGSDRGLRGAGLGVESFAQEEGPAAERFERAARRVFEARGGPLVIVGTDFPRLARYHADAALGDLREGCDVVLGVAIGGGLYLLGMRRPEPRLFALAGAGVDGEMTRRNAREVTEGLGLEVGMLHYERALVNPGDARALLADPLLPADLAEVLGPRRARGEGDG